ncbi:uncharacterized protein LOC121417628 [Lytechinus variegatus]|uniref:uncharacterized protein LOC121417628 n=1 Tax=Lytechinus variegatus TaxID=7654 RepID=UPI001BB25185|nr:uncharacterized protein LOC121417628 [Lytechinus variegatus]
MYHNRIAYIPAGLFSGLQKLQHIDLRHNLIAYIGPDAFTPLPSLQEVRVFNNFLQCTCDTYYNLVAIADFLHGSHCQEPDAAKGLVFDGNKTTHANYYGLFNNDSFLCTARTVSAFKPEPTNVTVIWEMPSEAYPGASSPPLEAEIQCTNEDNAPTLTANVDAIGTNSHTFTETDGVVTGIEYICSVGSVWEGNSSSRGLLVPAVGNQCSAHGNGTQSNDTEAPCIPLVTVPPDMNGQQLNFTISTYDFSLSHEDFARASPLPIYNSPKYVRDIFRGAWLRVSDDPEEDLFSSWFKSDPEVNLALTSHLTVWWYPDESLYR